MERVIDTNRWAPTLRGSARWAAGQHRRRGAGVPAFENDDDAVAQDAPKGDVLVAGVAAGSTEWLHLAVLASHSQFSGDGFEWNRITIPVATRTGLPFVARHATVRVAACPGVGRHE